MSTLNIGALKRDARHRVKTQRGLTLTAALNQVARENGYADWMTLARQAKPQMTAEPRSLAANEGPGT